MRTSFLQDLYLQRPVTLMILISLISVLPWIGLGDFATQEEAKEAVVAVSMLESGNMVLPDAYAGEFAYEPPMVPWLIAIFSYPQGYVSGFTSRLPSALAFIVLVGFLLSFFGKRLEKFHEAFIAIYLLITCLLIHRSAMTANGSMLFATFISIGLIQLYRWEEFQELKGLPVMIPVLLGFAVLTKGFVGIVLPLVIFGIYLLLLKKYRTRKVIKALVYMGIASLFIPLLWYIAAWKQEGDGFLEEAMVENFGHFFILGSSEGGLELGNGSRIWPNLVVIITGLLPWTLLLLFSLFGLKKPENMNNSTQEKPGYMQQVRLFSLVVAVFAFVFYIVSPVRRTEYLIMAYSFSVIFIGQYILYLAEYKTIIIRLFAAIIAAFTSVLLIAVILTIGGIIDPVNILSQYSASTDVLFMVSIISGMFGAVNILTMLLVVAVIIMLMILIYQIYRKINIKILYSTIALILCLYLLTDGVFIKAQLASNSSRAFAEKIKQEYPLQKNNLYVINDPSQYRNLYGLNFYMGDVFLDFQNQQPKEGYFLAGEKDMEKISKQYENQYTFTPLSSTERSIKEIKQKIVLSSFRRKMNM